MRRTMQDAIHLRSSGKAEEARVLLLEIFQEDKENPELLYQLAWTHDALGLEREAVPYYEKALQYGLSTEQRPAALLGLGSTYRTLGEYIKAKKVLEEAVHEFPSHRELKIFYSMVLYNLGEYHEAMKLLLNELVETTNDQGIKNYERAIRFYSDKLDQVWD